MALIETEGISDYKEESPLDQVWYGFHIDDVKPQREGAAILLKTTVIDGPEQKDGSDPIGRKVSDFVAVRGMDSDSDGGKFRKRIITSLLDAAGMDREAFDPDDLIGKEVNGLVSVGVDNRSKLPREQFTMFAPRD